MSNQELTATISDEQIEVLKSVSVFDLMTTIFEMGYPIVTRKLLLISQKLPSDAVTDVLSAAANILHAHATSEKWDVHHLQGNAATKQNIVDHLNKCNPDFVVYYGHSCNSDNWCGQKNDMPEISIGLHAGNVKLLSGRTASTVSCFTAKNMGPAAIKAKTIAYLGYMDYFSVVVPKNPYNVPTWLKLFVEQVNADIIEAANEPNKALLSGETYAAAYQKGYEAWTDKWKIYAYNLDPTPAIVMLNNRKYLLRLGEAKALARPMGILVTI